MKKRRILILAAIILGLCCAVSMSDTITVLADNETDMSKEAPFTPFNSDNVPLQVLRVGNWHGLNDQIASAVVQLDMSGYAGMTVIGDGTLTFWARLGDGQAEQYPPLDAWWIHELTKDYDVTEACWNEASWGDAWTASGGNFWDYGGCGDKGTLIGTYRVTYLETDWVQKTIPISQALIQSWLGDSTVSLHFGIHPDYYWSYFAGKGTYIAGTSSATPDGPILTFDCLELTTASVELGNTAWSHSAYGYDPFDGSVSLSVGNVHGLNYEMAAGYMQVDMNDVNDIVEIAGDGILRFEARIQEGHTQQTGGFQVHELNLDYVQSDVCWYEYSFGNTWTDTGADFWDYGGCGDTNSLIDSFEVVDHNWSKVSMNVSESMIQGWVDGTPSSLLFAVHEDYYNSFFAYRVIQVGGDGWYSPYNPTLEFAYVAEPACGDYAHPYPAGDVDKNCIVDVHDLAQMAAEWLVCTAPECD